MRKTPGNPGPGAADRENMKCKGLGLEQGQPSEAITSMSPLLTLAS